VKKSYHSKLSELLAKAEKARKKHTKGKALENAVGFAFCGVPGMSLRAQDANNNYHSEEIDLAFWNDQLARGFHFLPDIVLVESKNLSTPAGASEVSWLITKLRQRNVQFGVFVAYHGITGDPNDITGARDTIRNALRDGIRVVVVEREDLKGFRRPSELVDFFKTQLCQLTVRGSQF
jgi:hypothetical protein